MGGVQLHRSRPPAGDHLRHREALLRVVNRRGQQLGERLGAEPLAHRIPPGHHTGHGHRVDPALRHLLDALGGEELRGQPGRRPAAGVQAVHDAGLGLVVEDEEIAAEPVAGRLHQADGRVGGDSGIDGVAAPLEDLHAGAGGQRLAGGDDAERGGHDRSAHDRRGRAGRLAPGHRHSGADHDGRHPDECPRRSHGHLPDRRQSTPGPGSPWTAVPTSGRQAGPRHARDPMRIRRPSAHLPVCRAARPRRRRRRRTAARPSRATTCRSPTAPPATGASCRRA